MDLTKIIASIKALSAFIGESVLDEEELKSDKRKKKRVTLLSATLIILLVSDIPMIAWSQVKVVMAPPPREQEQAETSNQWIEFLERRITVSLNKIDELEDLLTKTRGDLRLSEQNRKQLDERIGELSEELSALKRLSDDDNEGDVRLYDRLQQSRDR